MTTTLASRPTLAAIAFFAVLLLTFPAFAQVTAGAVTGASADDSGGGQIADIVVTARKTSERLQDTPMSIAVITADTIERTSATTLVDLGRETPGLTVVSAAPGQNQVIL